MKRHGASLVGAFGLLFVAGWIGIPFYSLGILSLAPKDAPAVGLGLPSGLSLNHYAEVLSGVQGLWPYVANSIIASGAATLLALAVALPCAHGLSRLQRSAVARTLYLGVFVLRMLPPITLVIPFFVFMSGAHLLDTRTGLVGALLAQLLPLAIWISKTFFDGVPISIDEAARIDGATPWQVFALVALPIVAAGVAVTAVLTFLTAYIDYVFAATLTNDHAMTLPVYIAGFKTEYRFYVGDMLAATVIGTLPMLVLFLFVQRHMKRMALAGIH